MNQSVAKPQPYALNDRYLAPSGQVVMSGTQALVRIALEQARRDKHNGRQSAGFISGYRGSPLGGLDMELWRQPDLLADHHIEFLPAVNEDLAATAMLGTQQVESDPAKTTGAVFGLWYGKGPGLDRSGDALKHGNAYGSSPNGGVLVVAGDDHGCVSSSMPHQSDVAFMTWFMPVLNPASVNEYLAFGEYGYALSRYSGLWVGFKAISETVESTATVTLSPWRDFVVPDHEIPASGLHYRWPDLPGPQIEERLVAKKDAALAFARRNPIDHALYKLPDASVGIVTTGKGHLDLMEALRLLGLDEQRCRQLGIDVYKVGMVWPLAHHDALSFVRGKREILVIEEKRGIIESQFKEYFYDYPGTKPQRMVGKQDENGRPLVPWTGELSPRLLAGIVARRLDSIFPGNGFVQRAAQLLARDNPISVEGPVRTPYFCSGCPHNTSTRVPDGSRAQAGIGCHFMASWMDRNTSSLIQMGGEGVNWVASSRFTGNGHIFQNLGEGTYYHSGSMAIRQAVASGTNITYKILFNDAVAMTGGQSVDGPVSVQAIAHTVRAEGVQRIALVSDQPDKFGARDFPDGVTMHHRQDLDAVQRELRGIRGVSVLIYEQTCASEKRRRRKRGAMPPAGRVIEINEAVCEGCGDCSVQSNCLSVEPVETELGTKRRINQSTCNQDASCVDGYCPSFVSLVGDVKRRRRVLEYDPQPDANALPTPAVADLATPYNVLVTGVGGTGVVTVGALITMAAHLDDRAATVLDFTGFAQKFGPVLSYIRLANDNSQLNQLRIDAASADALIGCDAIVSTSPKATVTYHPGTRAVVNTAEMPTGDIVLARHSDLGIAARINAIGAMTDSAQLRSIDANDAAGVLMGDTVYANVIMLGHAWQSGLVPVSLASLTRAIELNGVAVQNNLAALAWGRLLSADNTLPDKWRGALAGTSNALQDAAPDEPVTNGSALHDRFVQRLVTYQDRRYGQRFSKRIAPLQEKIGALGLPEQLAADLAQAAMLSLYRLMAVKDEYEVARLQTDPAFLNGLSRQYDGNWQLRYHFASPLISRQLDAQGRPRKRSFGQWVQRPLRMLAAMRFVRGNPLDPFRYTAERQHERRTLQWFEHMLARMQRELTRDNASLWLQIMRVAQSIRGYGPVKASATATARARINSLLDNTAGTVVRPENSVEHRVIVIKRASDNATSNTTTREPM